ncbi:hypothetical protein M406DRAFT_347801 [Cryphonectria parasitica EP155]|uniref:Fatty acid desaturase domain-containing protein n=1 Tax=Cryphonectria parasitica (strain ATCC 38755 / EP155) TaxID=660469 RepID=A0A9P4XUR0_CRYP1|nr:uncharacterized protein M406DRAFT_347801 [Cryphonectria parasitica EP155]KAF3761354.1 hypothetical protein M406DRAFT_347801 [Cryphonectria parasitica EP155]
MATVTSTIQTRSRVAKQQLEAKDQDFPDVKTIKSWIPAHCFQPSVVTSMSYVVRDYVLAFGLGWAALTYIPQIQDSLLRTAAWIVYGYVQGLICVGIWILGHECGHGAFSTHRKFNDVMGWILHSSLLVPYFSWKFSHHRHHNYTGHMEKDMAFVPRTVEDRGKKRLANFYMDPEMFEDTPIVQATKLFFHQLVGWQTYLLINASAGKGSLQRDNKSWFRVSHFEPTSAVFRPNEALFIALSDLGLALTASALYVGSTYVGWQTVFLLYIVPYMWVHHWLVAITYLHHNHPEVHHYEPEAWTYVKGALATVDRDFGWVGRVLFHNIIDDHVVHHLFPRIPFYKAKEATEAIRPKLGKLYHRDDRSFLGQLWSVFTTCRYVEKDPDVPGAMRWANNAKSE